jgi:hypothetical protein
VTWYERLQGSRLLNNNTEIFQDSTHNVAKELITRLQADAMEMRTPRIQLIGGRPNENKDGLREEMDLVKSQGKWPVRYRIEKFTSGIFARVRLSNSPDFCHEMVRSVDGKNNGRNCALLLEWESEANIHVLVLNL